MQCGGRPRKRGPTSQPTTKAVERSAQYLFARAELARAQAHGLHRVRTSALHPIMLLGDPCLSDTQRDPVDLAVALLPSSLSARWSARPE
jgi:hypothetical protein